jgi:hypothetical protein
MYWDSLTAAGVYLSLLITLGILYLIHRDKPVLPSGKNIHATSRW